MSARRDAQRDEQGKTMLRKPLLLLVEFAYVLFCAQLQIAPIRTRTLNLLIKSQLLCQLSHRSGQEWCSVVENVRLQSGSGRFAVVVLRTAKQYHDTVSIVGFTGLNCATEELAPVLRVVHEHDPPMGLGNHTADIRASIRWLPPCASSQPATARSAAGHPG